MDSAPDPTSLTTLEDTTVMTTSPGTPPLRDFREGTPQFPQGRVRGLGHTSGRSRAHRCSQELGARLEGGRHPECVRGPLRPRRGASREWGVGLLLAAAPDTPGVQAARVARPLPPPAGTQLCPAAVLAPLSLARGHRRGGSSWLTAAHQVLSACPRALCHPWEGRCRARAS